MSPLWFKCRELLVLYTMEEIVQEVESTNNLMDIKDHVTYILGVLETYTIKTPQVSLRPKKPLLQMI